MSKLDDFKAEWEETKADKGQQALELWKRWFEWDGDPWEYDRYGWPECFFCGKASPDHIQDCVYVAAKELVAGEAEVSDDGKTDADEAEDSSD